MTAGSYRDAIPYLEAVGVYEKSCNPGTLGREIELSVCHWVFGDQEQGLRIIRDPVVAIRDRVVRYADLAGGVSQGVILWYMAEALNAKRDIDLARTFLTARANNKLRITVGQGLPRCLQESCGQTSAIGRQRAFAWLNRFRKTPFGHRGAAERGPYRRQPPRRSAH